MLPPQCTSDPRSPSPSGLTWGSRKPKCTLNRDDHQTRQEETCRLFLRSGLTCFKNESKSNTVRCKEASRARRHWPGALGECQRKEGGNGIACGKMQDSVLRRPMAPCFPNGRSGWRLPRGPLQEILETKNVSRLFGNK